MGIGNSVSNGMSRFSIIEEDEGRALIIKQWLCLPK